MTRDTDRHDVEIQELKEMIATLQKRVRDAGESERRYRNIILGAPLPSMIHAEDGEIVLLNDAWSDITGYTSDDIPTIPVWLEKGYRGNEKSRNRVRDQLNDLFSINLSVTHGETEITTVYGDKRIWNFTSAPLGALADGRKITITMAMDVTERVVAEQARKQSEEKYRMLADTVPGAIFSCAYDEHWTMNFIGRQITEMSGFPATDFIDNRVRSFAEIIHPDDQEETTEQVAEQVHNDEPWRLSYRIVHADGSVRYVREEGKAVRNSVGEIINLVGFIHDITEQKKANDEKKKLEQQLRQTQKMETVGTLAGGIAHDFNNLLTPILGFADMGRTKTTNAPDIRRYFEKIFTGASHAGELIDQLLTFSRGKESEKRPLGLGHVIKEALKLLRHTIPASIRINEEIDTSCPNILADPVQMHQIIVNLCANAFQAIGDKGEIRVSLKHTTEVDDNTPGQVVLSVSDNGSGMSNDVRERIFEPFFTTRQDNGVGLGLSVVHGIISEHNAVISVDSEQGNGTAITIGFNAMDGTETTAESGREEEPVLGTGNILLVDDYHNVAEMVSVMLRELGYTVTVHTDSAKALSAFTAEPDAFDLLISDVTMPDLTGPELVGRAHEIRPDLPVIYMTGYGSSTPENLLNSGESHITLLKKPLLRGRLSRIIRDIIS